MTHDYTRMLSELARRTGGVFEHNGAAQVEIPNYQKLINQLTQLERRTGRGTGRDVIDHAEKGHDDVANVVCGLIATRTSAPKPSWGAVDLLSEIGEDPGFTPIARHFGP